MKDRTYLAIPVARLVPVLVLGVVDLTAGFGLEVLAAGFRAVVEEVEVEGAPLARFSAAADGFGAWLVPDGARDVLLVVELERLFFFSSPEPPPIELVGR